MLKFKINIFSMYSNIFYSLDTLKVVLLGENDTLIWARAFYLISLITLLISIINFWMFGLRWKESFSCGYLSFFFVVASGKDKKNVLKDLIKKIRTIMFPSLVI